MKIFKRDLFDDATEISEANEFKTEWISTGSKKIDALLGGGIPTGFVTHVYGPPGIGKTNLCLSTTRIDGKILFIDTEGGFSPERLKQICGKIPNNIFIKQVKDFDEQGRVIRGLCKVLDKDFKLIVIDSIVSLYRLRVEDDRKKILKIARELGKQLAHLSKIAREKKVAIIVTNQVYSSFDGKEEIIPVGGDTLMYWSKIILELSKEKTRRMIIRKHPHKPENVYEKFEIVQKGIR